MSEFDNPLNYKWVSIVPNYKTVTGLQFVGDPIVICLPLFQEAQNMTMDRIWRCFMKYGSDLTHLDITSA